LQGRAGARLPLAAGSRGALGRGPLVPGERLRRGRAQADAGLMKMAVQAPVILCCATKWEALPLARRWGLRRTSPFRHEGGVAGVPVAVVKTGIGPANAEEALRSLPVAP